MKKTITRKGFVRSAGTAFGALLLTACGGSEQAATDTPEATDKQAAADEQSADEAAIDYKVLVNWQHELPAGWEEALDLAEEESLLYSDPVRVERKAYEAWLGLKEELAAEGTYVELDSCYRSVAEQQEVWDEFTVEYGEEYVKTHVAQPGFSEHHTGLALDLFLVIDGEQVYLNEEMVQHPEVWEKVHAKLADHGFILRYLPRRCIFTHCSYEPWHIRYLDDTALAKEIMDEGLTYEEYLGEVRPFVAGCTVDYGDSEIYGDSDIDAGLNTVLGEFETWEGCVMERFAYAGDDACGADELEYVNSLREEGTDEFGQAMVLVTDFHSPSADQAKGSAWEPDTDYLDYTWHLGRADADGAWKLLTWGYA